MSSMPKTLAKQWPAHLRKDVLLRKFVGVLVEKHGCHTVILYGSRAAGTANAESDYDLLGFRDEGEPTRDARFVDGAFLDAFIYIAEDLSDAAPSMLQVHRGVPLLDPRGIAARLIADVENVLQSPPPKAPAAEVLARREWCKKMLGRVRRGGPLDVEAHFRRHWLLVELLELYFVFRNKHFLGPKRSFLILEAEDKKAHQAFAAALAPGAPFSAVETLVEMVLASGGGSLVKQANKKQRSRVASDAELLRALDNVRAHCDVELRKAADPVRFVHRYQKLEDQELVALIASSLAFGNVKALCAKIEDALLRLGPEVALIADSPNEVFARLLGWKHRLYQSEDLGRLLVGARAVQRARGSLGKALSEAFLLRGNLRDALSDWVLLIRQAGGFSENDEAETVGGAHLLPDPRRGSAVKRLLLLVRWMARDADGVDLGLWDIPTSKLIIPVDTHIHKLSKNLGLTSRNAADYRAAEEITAALARLDPNDPVKYDFSLCHLGMVQDCPSQRDDEVCAPCGVRPVCRHWQAPSA